MAFVVKVIMDLACIAAGLGMTYFGIEGVLDVVFPLPQKRNQHFIVVLERPPEMTPAQDVTNQ
jgi:hypothetical protein